MFTDVHVAEVIRAVDRERTANRAYDACVTSVMPDAVYSDAFHYARLAGLIKVVGMSVWATRHGRSYARRTMRQARYTARMSDVIAARTARHTLPDWAVTSDDFDGPMARTPGMATR